jgi:PAS domain S-box-containing protein
MTARKQAEENTRRLAEETAARQAVFKERERLHVTLASIGDAVISTDAQGRVEFLNPVAEGLIGWKSVEAVGRALEDIFRIFNEDSRLPVENPALRTLREGVVIGLANHTVLIAKDGVERRIDDSAAPIRNAEGDVIGSVLVFRDVGEQRKVEQHRTARLAVTHALSEAPTVHDGARGVLRAVCESLSWDVGFFWLINDGGTLLECRESWHRPEVPVSDFETTSCGFNFEKGRGLPGRVWASAKPEWILDIARDANFPRLSAAVSYGLHSAFAYPISVGDRTLGVIEFFSRRIRDTDAGLLEMMGTVAGGVGQFIERKSAEEELRRSEQELADFFENATIGLHCVGPDGTILRANRAELDMLGYCPEEYVGHHIAEFHADEEAICEILRRLRAREHLGEYPARMRCRDGSIKDVLIDSSVLWRDGEFVHTRCFTRDVTASKQAEDRLRESESRLQAVLDHTPAIVYVVDAEGRFRFINRRWQEEYGLTNEKVVGRRLHDFFPTETADQFVRNNLRVLEAGSPSVFEESILEGGNWRTFMSVKMPFNYGAGSTPSICGISTDITERKRLEDELRETDRRKDEFLATLAHELRSPLAPIRNALQILKMPRVDAETVERSREMMERQVNHLVRLVDDLLDVSRVMRGKIELRRETVELASVVARAVETAQPLIEVQGHRLEITLPSESLLLDADPVRLAQVVGNLLTNAAKYTEPGGRIRLTAQRDGDMVELRVRDTGIGIASHMLPRIFDLFVQADHASTKAQGGLGIGLTLVKNLVEMHTGTVEARSEGLGKGSEFVVRLPMSSLELRQDRLELRSRSDSAIQSGLRLLVVDDNRDAAVSLAMLLKLQGHEVRVAHSGSAALEMTNSYVPHAVFLDLGMPVMDGYEVARRIRQQPGLENVVLAALTGWGQREDRRRTAEAGFDHHLVKPPEPQAVEAILAALPK